MTRAGWVDGLFVGGVICEGRDYSRSVCTLRHLSAFQCFDMLLDPDVVGCSSSSQSSSDCEYDGSCGSPQATEMSPRALLSVAIKRRRAVCNRRERDLRLEVLHTSLIQTLCKCLGEARAKRRRQRKRRRNCSSKREYSDNTPMDSYGSVGLACHNIDSGIQCSGILENSFDYICPSQPNCVQLKSISFGAEAEVKESEPPRKKWNFEGFNSDQDPFGLDSLFAELYAPSNADTGLTLKLYNQVYRLMIKKCLRDCEWVSSKDPLKLTTSEVIVEGGGMERL